VDREGLIDTEGQGVEGQVGEGKGAKSHARSEAGKKKESNWESKMLGK
jgi:hypothetical protein